MAKITRKQFLQFGVNANAAADICEFGTPATGAPVYTADIDTLQANSAWLTGWAAETIASNRPFLEDMNAYCAVVAYMIAYQFEMGIPEYISTQTYYINSICQYGGVLYQSLTDNNTGNTPVVGANWKLVFTVVAPISAGVYLSGDQTIATGNTWTKIAFDTKDWDTSSNFNTGSNTFTCPNTGKYQISIGTSKVLNQGELLGVSIYKNGSPVRGGQCLNNNYGSGYEISVSASIIVNCAANDTITFYCIVGQTGNTNFTLLANSTEATIIQVI